MNLSKHKAADVLNAAAIVEGRWLFYSLRWKDNFPVFIMLRFVLLKRKEKNRKSI